MSIVETALLIRHAREEMTIYQDIGDGETLQRRVFGEHMVYQIVAAENSGDGFYPIGVIQRSWQDKNLAQYATYEEAEAELPAMMRGTGATRIIAENDLIKL